MPDDVTAAARNSAIRDKAIRETEDWVRARIWTLEDAAANTLYGLYKAAYNDLAGKLTTLWMQAVDAETWSINDANSVARTEALLSLINAEVERLLAQSQEIALNAATSGYQGGFYGRAWVLDTGLRGAAEAKIPALLPTDAIRAAILAPYGGSTFLHLFADARSEFERLIRRSIVESQIRGESIRQAIKRLGEALGVTSRDEARALFARIEMIARTEILRASNEGAMAIYEANDDILEGWRWLATEDERTCPTCGALDGEVFKFSDPQSPPPEGSHPRCRCTPTPVLINAEMGKKITGERQTYRDWAADRGIGIISDGGVLRFRPSAAPKSNSDAAKSAAKSY